MDVSSTAKMWQGDTGLDEDELIAIATTLSLQPDTLENPAAEEFPPLNRQDNAFDVMGGYGSYSEGYSPEGGDAQEKNESSSSSPHDGPPLDTKNLFTKIHTNVKKKYFDSNAPAVALAHSATLKTGRMYEDAKTGIGFAFNSVVKSIEGGYWVVKGSVMSVGSGTLWVISPVTRFIGAPAFRLVEASMRKATDPEFYDEVLRVITRWAPFGMGVKFIVPAANFTRSVASASYQVMLMPIPQPTTVANATIRAIDGTKWFGGVVAREVGFYVSVIDVSIHRTLTKAQWKIIGSGPYLTLTPADKSIIVDTTVERYFSLDDSFRRYEFVVLLRVKSSKLWSDFLEKMRAIQGDEQLDEWLKVLPEFLAEEENDESCCDDGWEVESLGTKDDLFDAEGNKTKVGRLWFSLMSDKNGPIVRERAWQRFSERDRVKLEEKWGAVGVDEGEGCCDEDGEKSYTAKSRWAQPDKDRDVFVDESRFAVTRVRDGFFIKVPVFWRYREADKVRASNWLIAGRNGLQPFDGESETILEEAYQFLKWSLAGDDLSSSTRSGTTGQNSDHVLLTLQLLSPCGSFEELVQFRSLSLVISTRKSIVGALSPFKRRVYRGAEILRDGGTDFVHPETKITNSANPLAAPLSFSANYGADVVGDDCGGEICKHLILVVHGIGDAFSAVDLFGILSLNSIITSCDNLRRNHKEVSCASY